MREDFSKFISIINEFTSVIEKLAETQKDIISAASSDDIEKLADCMKKEQVYSMTIRSMEQKRIQLQKEMGFENFKLSEMPSKAPDVETQIELKNAADRLKAQYKIMKTASSAARFRLECGLRKVEQLMGKVGIDPAQTEMNLIDGMHTDFHA